MKGILLINLGSPKDLEFESIKDYLKEFLSDDLVIVYPKIKVALIFLLFLYTHIMQCRLH